MGNFTEPTQYVVGWILFICVNPVVDIYVLMSGYMGFREEHEPIKYSKYIRLWIQVLFYCIISMFIVNSQFKHILNWDIIIKCFISVASDQYWFFTRYSVLFLFMPVIKRFAANCSKRELTIIVVVCVGVFSLYVTLLSPVFNILDINAGYSFVWFLVLYLVGVWRRKCDIENRFSKKKAGIILLGATLIPAFMKTVGVYLTKEILGNSFGDDFLISYISPTTLVIAMAYIIIFSQLKLGKRITKLISFFAPSAFAVYLIHDNRLIRASYILDKFGFVTRYSASVMFLLIIGIAIFIMMCGLCIEVLRRYFFGRQEKKLEIFICEKIEKLMHKI